MSISATEARRRLFPLLEEVNDDRVAVEIVARNGENAYLVPAAEYESMVETMHLMRSPVNASRLDAAYRRAAEGVYESHDLDRGNEGRA